MKIKVMYHSKTGNTKKVAEAIAQTLNQRVETIPPSFPLENVGLLFIGAGVYAGKIDTKVEDFIRTLNTSRVRNVAVFGTSGKDNTGMLKMQELLKEQGINIIDESFLCKGRTFFLFSRKHPSKEDLSNASDFAKRVMAKLGK